MKKKCLSISLVIIMLVVGLFTFVGCGDKKKDENKEASKSYTTITVKEYGDGDREATFDNSKEIFKINEEYADATAATVLVSDKLGVQLNMYITDTVKQEIEQIEHDKIQEYTWNGFKGYAFDNYAGSIRFIIILEDNGDKLIVVRGDIRTISATDTEIDVKAIMDSNEIQEILNSIKYSK